MPVIAWILVAVSSSGGGMGGFAVPAYSPPVATKADCEYLLEATRRVLNTNKGMECVKVVLPAKQP